MDPSKIPTKCPKCGCTFYHQIVPILGLATKQYSGTSNVTKLDSVIEIRESNYSAHNKYNKLYCNSCGFKIDMIPKEI